MTNKIHPKNTEGSTKKYVIVFFVFLVLFVFLQHIYSEKNQEKISGKIAMRPDEAPLLPPRPSTSTEDSTTNPPIGGKGDKGSQNLCRCPESAGELADSSGCTGADKNTCQSDMKCVQKTWVEEKQEDGTFTKRLQRKYVYCAWYGKEKCKVACPNAPAGYELLPDQQCPAQAEKCSAELCEYGKYSSDGELIDSKYLPCEEDD